MATKRHTHTHTHTHTDTVSPSMEDRQSTLHKYELPRSAMLQIIIGATTSYGGADIAMSVKWCVYVSVCACVCMCMLIDCRRNDNEVPCHGQYIHIDDVVRQRQIASQDSECTVHLAASQLTAENYSLSLPLSLSPF